MMGKRGKILAIDDNEDILFAIKLIGVFYTNMIDIH